MGETVAGGRTADLRSAADGDPLDVAETWLVSAWIRPAAGDVAVSFGPLQAEPLLQGTAGIHLTFLGVSPATQARVSSRQPQSLLMFARYLVTTTAASQGEADRLIVALTFAAVERGVPELERDGALPELWLGLRAATRPALIVRVGLERPRQMKRVPLVRYPLVTEWTDGRSVAGRIVGPDQVPIAGARIEVVHTALYAYSDHRGEFAIAGVPAGPPLPTLVVTAKGVKLSVQPESDKPLVILVPLPEL